MKKRILFASLCIPALFAACTQDELAEVQKNVNREKINIELASQGISFGSSADTRMGATETEGNGVKYSWISSDKLGAAVLDGTTQGAINNDDKVIFNYAFNREGNDVEGSKFTAASPVMKGIYTFYHQYNASVSRDKLAFKIEENQVYDATSENDAAFQMAQYVQGISPAVDLTATGIAQDKAANLELPVKFANFGVPFKLQIKAAHLPASGAELQRIVITKNGNDNIANGGNLDFSGLTTGSADRVAVTATSEVDALADEFADKVKGTIDAVNKATIFADATDSKSIAVTVKGNGEKGGIALSENKTITVYVVMPNNNTVDGYNIKIQTSQGFREIENAQFAFRASGGETTNTGAGVVAPSAVTLDFNTNGTGNIEQPTTFKIPAEYSWEEALGYINDHPALYMTIPVFFDLTGNANIDLKESASYPAFQNLNMTLTSNGHKLTVKDNNLTMKVSSWTFADAATIVLDEDKTMTVAGLPTLSANLTFENNGTLTLQGVTDATNLKVENYKTLNVTAESSLAGLTNAADATTAVNAGTKLTVGDLGTNIGLGSGNATGTIDVKGTLEITGSTCTNAGTINVQSSATLKPNADLSNNGTINNAGTITATGTSKITNGTDGVINLKKGGVSNGASGVEYDAATTGGKIVIEDIADFVAIATEGKYNFTSGSKVTTEVKSYTEYNSALDVQALSDITLNGGTWKIAKDAVPASEVIAMPTTSISTKGTVTLVFDATAFDDALDLTVESGSVALKSVDNIGVDGGTEDNSTATIGISNLTIKKGASMSVPASITVNEAAQSNTAEASIGGTLTVDGKMYFNEAQVGAADNTVATLTLNPHEVGKDAAVFGVQSTFNNYGTVSAATVNETDVRGVVTAANNVGNGKIIGKWAEDGVINWQ